MCRWLVYHGKSTYLDEYVLNSEHSLIDQSLNSIKSKTRINADGFGIGWFSDRNQPGIFKDILPAWGDENLKSVSSNIKSDLFMAHIRASTGTATIRPNCHPFSYNEMMFMHNGQIGGYELIRRDLESMLDDEFYSHRKGTTDSELIFLLLVQFCRQMSFKDSLQKLIHKINELTKAKSVNEAFRLSCVLSDYKNLQIVRYSSDHLPPTVFYKKLHCGWLIVSEPLDTEESVWKKLKPNSILTIDSKKTAKSVSISDIFL